MAKMRVLLAEDDFDFGSILKQYLELHDFEVSWGKDGEEALALFNLAVSNDGPGFHICVFDVMMPKMDGFKLAEKVIAVQPEVSFIFLTAKSMKEDRLRGLQLGADDYILKPFDADILVLRIKNILKRVQQVVVVSPDAKEQQQIGKYRFDAVNHQLKNDGHVQHLTEKEVQLMQFMIQHKNEMVKREDLLQNVWGSDDFFSGRSMDVFISRIRKYFKDDPDIAIESTRGVGLTFKIESSENQKQEQ